MKKLLSIMVFSLLLSGNAHSNNNLPGLIFNSGTCSISSDMIFNLEVNAESRKILFHSTSQDLKSVYIPIDRIDSSGTVHAKTITLLDIINQKMS